MTWLVNLIGEGGIWALVIAIVFVVVMAVQMIGGAWDDEGD